MRCSQDGIRQSMKYILFYSMQDTPKRNLSRQKMSEKFIQNKPPMVKRKKSPQTVVKEKRQQSVESIRGQKVATTQTDSNKSALSNRKIDLLVENKKLQLKLKLQKKKTRGLRQKLSKMMFFFYSLHKEKNIPVNQIYEEEGIRQIPTIRFNKIMA